MSIFHYISLKSLFFISIRSVYFKLCVFKKIKCSNVLQFSNYKIGSVLTVVMEKPAALTLVNTIIQMFPEADNSIIIDAMLNRLN